MDRKLVTIEELKEWMNRELHEKMGVSLNCKIYRILRLEGLNKYGNNWSSVVTVGCSGMPADNCKNEVQQVVSKAQKLFNLAEKRK